MPLKTGFLHIVYFWLREDADTDDADKLAEGCKTFLSNIPGVLRLEAGFPAGTMRDVVDNSFGVCLLVEFENRESHDIYQDHQDHLAFIQACHSLWSRVQVYDSIIGS